MKRSARTMRLALLVTCYAGCTGRASSNDRYVPEPGNAMAALEAALADWQNGDPAGEIRKSSPQVQVVDTHRRPDQKLLSFEVLGEVGGDTGRSFLVRLALENPTEEQKVRYLVVGVNPLWVFREEDYSMFTHWEHPMPDESKDSRK